MKKLLLIPALALIAFIFLQATVKDNESIELETNVFDDKIPPHVKAVIDQKCYGCHNAESKNEKGKQKLDWDELEASRKAKQLATMAKINETLVNGDMPPAKFLESKPEGKLTKEELETLLDWSAGKKKSPK
ncbi:heme-binding domain-containing protein [Cecembia calidifontis]|uniref:Heme-binding protein n=1 Tax=Cecembia calidifontis TaxID=1187080 RepID=A0A4Q7PAT0_9BACT|nr:heme-binding domain-containing protein [Cecembia calidifontis]RZS97383.1 heme-binding protein [Cecembia calidifontis]